MNDMWNELQRFRAYLLFKMTETVNVVTFQSLFNDMCFYYAITMWTMILLDST